MAEVDQSEHDQAVSVPAAKSGTSGMLRSVVWLLLMLLCGYVASIGPMVWLWNHGYMSPWMVDYMVWFYAPLEEFVDEFNWLENLLYAYLSLFE
jgi:hypothetical protein